MLLVDEKISYYAEYKLYKLYTKKKILVEISFCWYISFLIHLKSINQNIILDIDLFKIECIYKLLSSFLITCTFSCLIKKAFCINTGYSPLVHSFSFALQMSQ